MKESSYGEDAASVAKIGLGGGAVQSDAGSSVKLMGSRGRLPVEPIGQMPVFDWADEIWMPAFG